MKHQKLIARNITSEKIKNTVLRNWHTRKFIYASVYVCTRVCVTEFTRVCVTPTEFIHFVKM